MRDKGSLEKWLAKKLERMASWSDPSPKLTGALPAREALASMSEDEAERWLIGMRWPQGQSCPKCGHDAWFRISTRRRFKCKACHHQYSVLAGTAFASHKKSYRDLLELMTYDGPGYLHASQSVTVYKMRRRLSANG